MKHLFIFFACFLCVVTSFAQDNTICDRAIEIAIDQTLVVSTTTSSTARWYKLTLTEGKTYVFTHTSSLYAVTPNSYNKTMHLYNACNGSILKSCYSTIGSPSGTGQSGNSFIYQPTTAGTYYLFINNGFYYYNGNKVSSEVRVFEAITPNLLCSDAMPIYLSEVLTTPQAEYATSISTSSTIYNDNWYAVSLEAGKVYKINTISGVGNYEIYSSCSSGILGNKVFFAATTGLYYIRVQNTSSSYNCQWQVDETDITDNSVCLYAEQMSLGQTMTLSNASTYYWYKVTLEANKLYQLQSRYSMQCSVYDSCEGSEIAALYASSRYIPTTSGTYYIRVYTSTAGNRWTLSDIDASATDVSSSHSASLSINSSSITTYRWYKVELTADNIYGFRHTSTVGASPGLSSNINKYLHLYSRNGNLLEHCYSEIATYRNSGSTCAAASLFYKPTLTDTYYILLDNSIRFTNQDTRSSFTITTMTTASPFCASAVPINLNETIATPEPYLVDCSQRIDSYWNYITLEAGKAYEVSGHIGNYAIYDSCDGNEITISDGGYYELPFTGRYYVQSKANQNWQIYESNRLCGNAEPAALNQNIEVPGSGAGIYYWYKAELGAGKPYTVEWISGSGSSFYVYDACGGSVKAGGDPTFFTPIATGTHYFRVNATITGSRFKISGDEVSGLNNNQISGVSKIVYNQDADNYSVLLDVSAQNIRMDVYSVEGQLVSSQSFYETDAFDFDLYHCSKGLYLVKIVYDGKYYTQKLIK